ncbi:hypothetical protein ACFL6O_03165 [candidate division KSB1 bacterium]
MLRIVTFTVILSAVIWLAVVMRTRRAAIKIFLMNTISGAKGSFIKVKKPRSLDFRSILKCLDDLAFFTAVISAVFLAITGFLPYLLFGRPVTGYPLVLHVTISPFFAVSMTVLILLRAQSHVFRSSDKQMKSNVDKKNAGSTSETETSGKICFWLIAVLTPVLMGSIILCMYPLFGMEAQKFLLTSHHISALLFIVIVFYNIHVKTKSAITIAETEK